MSDISFIVFEKIEIFKSLLVFNMADVTMANKLEKNNNLILIFIPFLVIKFLLFHFLLLDNKLRTLTRAPPCLSKFLLFDFVIII